MKTRKVIKIDVVNKSVYEVEIGSGIQSIYDGLGLNCTMFEIPTQVKSPKGISDDVFVDEEGLIHGVNHIQGGFVIIEEGPFMRNKGPFVNNGLVMGHDKEGNSTSHHQDLEDLKSKIVFYSQSEMLKFLS